VQNLQRVRRLCHPVNRKMVKREKKFSRLLPKVLYRKSRLHCKKQKLFASRLKRYMIYNRDLPLLYQNVDQMKRSVQGQVPLSVRWSQLAERPQIGCATMKKARPHPRRPQWRHSHRRPIRTHFRGR
jgi:hypothetical protein